MRVIAVRNPLALIGAPPYPNNTFWAIGLRLCAGPSGSDDAYLPLYTEAHTSQGDQAIPSNDVFRSSYPALLSVDLKPHQCETGWAEGRWERSLHPVPYQIRFGLDYFELTR